MNQSENGTAGKKLSMELYDDHSLVHKEIVASSKFFHKTFFKYRLHLFDLVIYLTTLKNWKKKHYLRANFRKIRS